MLSTKEQAQRILWVRALYQTEGLEYALESLKEMKEQLGLRSDFEAERFFNVLILGETGE